MKNKRNILVVLIIFVVFLIISCKLDCEETLDSQISIKEVFKNPNNFLGKRKLYSDGIVIYKSKKKKNTTIIITQYPLSEIKLKDEINENILMVKIKKHDYNNIKVGDIVQLEGLVKKLNKKGKNFFYIDSLKIIIVKNIDFKDINFEKLIEKVNKKSNDNDFIETIFLLSPSMGLGLY